MTHPNPLLSEAKTAQEVEEDRNHKEIETRIEYKFLERRSDLD